MIIRLIDGTTIFTDYKNVMVRISERNTLFSLWVSGTAQGEISAEEYIKIRRVYLNSCVSHSPR